MPLTNIYALCEPGSQTPRYIGQTTFPLGHRLSNHVASAKRGKSSNGLFASDAEAVDWFKTTHPAEFAIGAEMRVFDQ